VTLSIKNKISKTDKLFFFLVTVEAKNVKSLLDFNKIVCRKIVGKPNGLLLNNDKRVRKILKNSISASLEAIKV
jgi:hypothetical protein